MATVTLRLAPRPAHVRTARLVASAMARRGGVSEDLLDDVRLAVGEACARAVRLHERHGVRELVTIELTDGDGFTVVVADCVADDTHGEHDELVAGAVTAGRVAPAGQPVPAAHGGGQTGQAGRGAAQHQAPIRASGAGAGAGAGADPWVESERLGLAVLAAVVDDLRVERGPHGTRVLMRWPVDR